MKVEQFIHANQFRLYGNNENILQSYNSQVVKITNYRGCETCIILGRDWDYSTTTSKHVYEFLEEYGNINFYGVKNKRKFVNQLIKENKIFYDENMF